MADAQVVHVPRPSAAPTIQLFDDVCIHRDGTSIEVAGEGRRALLALLACHPGRTVPFERILDALWEGEPPITATKVVQTYVSQLRRLLEPDASGEWTVLVTRPAGYALLVGRGDTDIGEFEAAAEDACSKADGRAADHAVGLWRGEPLAGISQGFARAEADRLHRLRNACLLHRLRELVATGRAVDALPELEELQRADPVDEAVVVLHMEALWRAGRRSAALKEFERLREVLADELGIDPGEEASALHLAMLRDEVPTGRAGAARPEGSRADPPQPGGADAERGGSGPGQRSAEAPVAAPAPSPGGAEGHEKRLPAERTPLIGRGEHVAGLGILVRDEPLVTVVGPGGAGKTRVALRVAYEHADPGEVWWVSLGGFASASSLPGHVSRAVGMPQQFDHDAAEALVAWLTHREGLLVLDNCEHLVAPVAGLVERILERVPGLHVLATSRVPLHVHGERRWHIPALGLPEGDSLGELRASASGRLLLERAGRAGDSFGVDAGDAAHLARVCRRLDGMPLALELAAARLAGMSAADLDSGLNERFRLLTSGDRAGPEQHRTLRATTEWSYQLLNERERLMLDRMAVFVGPVEASAVAAVCVGEGIDAADVPTLLADLVEQCVIEREGDRYALLETVKEFGRENLGASAVEWEQRHGEWMAAVVEQVGAGLQGATATWIRVLESHLLDARAAFDRALARGDVVLAMRLAARGNWALLSLGRFALLRQWIARALEAAERVDVPTELRAEAELLAGALAGIVGRRVDAHRELRQARERFVELGDDEHRLWVDYWSATVLGEERRFHDAIALGRRAAEEARMLGLVSVEANLRAGIAEVALVGALAVPDDADELLAAARQENALGLERCRDARLEEVQLRLETNLALESALVEGRASGLDRCLELLEAWRAYGRGVRRAVAAAAVASLAVRRKRADVAVPLALESLEVLDFLGWEGPVPNVLDVVVAVAHTVDPEECARLLGAVRARVPTYRWRVPCDTSVAETVMMARLSSARWAELLQEGANRPLALTTEAAARVLRATASVGEGRTSSAEGDLGGA
ncbi:AfsR/SARP family transcriptional regulator [Demequina zhanjiangensis]|uniref:BTAD domain-containing putative transcriptional regulator n=1 Tax=Demequina zhanjiangensis TaxID=3051659 RepID=A0ABT8FYA5_9MICO|nr:BTAD domain-containing putative transcriptional regulator [Demequina sp. SYSU T00b26]MDN4471807.1 BTAD domain-containing putative transcriptional regulator [Demequina sp. SYSU T00b26]